MEGCEADPGIILNSIMFLINEKQKFPLEINCSLAEIYNEKLNDLLLGEHETTSKPISICQKISISGSTENRLTNSKEVCIQSIDQFKDVFESANKRRKVAATQRNNGSSRSHAVIQVTLKGRKNNKKFESNLLICDLAGSENAGDHLTGGQPTMRSMEMNNINKSLSAFGTVIENLKKKEVADYRSSLLTQLLKPSLSSNTKTLIITTVSQDVIYLGSSKHSLCLANAARKIKITDVKPNSDPSSSQ